MKKSILSLGAQELCKKEQKGINGGDVPFRVYCRGKGETGQSCITTSECIGPGDPVCYQGCCNIVV